MRLNKGLKKKLTQMGLLLGDIALLGLLDFYDSPGKLSLAIKILCCIGILVLARRLLSRAGEDGGQ